MSRNQIVDREGHQLGEALEVFTDKAPFVATDVFGVHRRRIEPVRAEGFETHPEYVHRLGFIDE